MPDITASNIKYSAHQLHVSYPFKKNELLILLLTESKTDPLHQVLNDLVVACPSVHGNFIFYHSIHLSDINSKKLKSAFAGHKDSIRMKVFFCNQYSTTDASLYIGSKNLPFTQKHIATAVHEFILETSAL